MSVTVDLIFTGICAFVQLKDGGIAAVMPNASQDPMHPHIPWMMVAVENSDGTIPFQKANGQLGAWYLREVNMSLRGSSNGPDAQDDEGNWGEAPNGAHLTSTHWVASFPKILGGASVKPEYLNGTDPRAVAFWFRLPNGTFKTKSVRDCVWELKSKSHPNSVKLRQALAQEVALETTIDDTDAVTLVETDLYTSTTFERKLLLHGKKSIEILFGNTPDSEIFPTGAGDSDVDNHFGIYYRMLMNAASTPADWPIPNKVKGMCPALVVPSSRSVRFRLGGANCPPAFMY